MSDSICAAVTPPTTLANEDSEYTTKMSIYDAAGGAASGAATKNSVQDSGTRSPCPNKWWVFAEYSKCFFPAVHRNRCNARMGAFVLRERSDAVEWTPAQISLRSVGAFTWTVDCNLRFDTVTALPSSSSSRPWRTEREEDKTVREGGGVNHEKSVARCRISDKSLIDAALLFASWPTV